MKTKITLLILLIFSGFAMNAQAPEAPQTNLPVITKIAATWCPPCGSWGWDFFEHLLEDNSEDAIFMAVHHSGDLVNPTATALTSNLNASSQPRFFFNNEDQGVSSGNVTAKRTQISSAVNQFSQGMPVVQTGLDASWNGTTLNVEYNTEFFQNASGEYYLAFYVLEKLVIAQQASIGSNAQHEQILRTEVNGDNFGSQLTSGSVISGEVFSGMVSMDLGSYDTDNLEIAALIYKKSGSTYTVINANKDADVQQKTISAVTESVEDRPFSFDVIPVDNTWNVSVSKSLKNGVITLYNLNGSRIEILHEGPISANQDLTIKSSNALSSGLYLINIYSEEGMITKKVFVE
jgi:hypothetical protein